MEFVFIMSPSEMYPFKSQTFAPIRSFGLHILTLSPQAFRNGYLFVLHFDTFENRFIRIRPFVW